LPQTVYEVISLSVRDALNFYFLKQKCLGLSQAAYR